MQRPQLRHLGPILIIILWAGGVAAAMEAAPAPRPNLLVIQTDEHNFRTLGCYRALLPEEQAFPWGREAFVETPHIDSIAKSGALCTSFYATTPVCSPSRAAFVSGRYPHNTPVNTNNIPLDDGIITFAELLRRQGYRTGYAGKWHLDGTGKPQWAPERKFGFEDNRYLFNRGHWKQLEDTPEGPRVKARNPRGRPTYSVVGADGKSFTTDFLADRTIEFIVGNKTGPFCYMVSFPDPHGPDTVRPPYDTLFQGQKSRPPRTFHKADEGLPSWASKSGRFLGMAAYHGMVKCIDDNVGRILESLRRHGLSDRTVVVFTSDHGDLRGEHHRQNKGVPFEGSARIPFVIRYPGKIRPGTVIHEALSCVDFLPTVCSLMGCPTSGREEGRDASALFLEGKAPEGWTDISFLRGTGVKAGWLAAVTDRYKLIYSTRDEPWLFDLEKDPDELINRFEDPAYREAVRDLSRQLQSYGRQHEDPRAAEPAIQAQLEAAVSGASSHVSPQDLFRLECRDAATVRAYQLALNVMQGNISGEGPAAVLNAGRQYGRPWTRDASYNTYFALGLISPQVARNTLLSVLEDGRIGGQYWDAISWVTGAWEYYAVTGDREFLSVAFDAAIKSLEHDRSTRFNARTGLFQGPGWSDGIAGYPIENVGASSFVLDYPYFMKIEALSTNCLFCNAYRLAARMASRLDKDAAVVANLEEKASRLRAAVERNLWMEEVGRYAYFIDAGGRREPNIEALGHSFVILFDIAGLERAERVFQNQYVSPYGIPCNWPLFPRFEGDIGRHCGTVWPQIQGFWALAGASRGKLEILDHELKALTRCALESGDFREIYHPETGKPEGGLQCGRRWESCQGQSWAATAWLAMIHRGVLGMRFEPEGIAFRPLVPERLSGTCLRKMRYRQMLLDVVTRGHGVGVKGFFLDGKRQERPWVDGGLIGKHTVEVELKGGG